MRACISSCIVFNAYNCVYKVALTSSWVNTRILVYPFPFTNDYRQEHRIRPNFWGAQFSRIAISKHFAETVFVDQEFRVYGIQKFRELNFRGLLKSVKTAKIMRRKNLDVYGKKSNGSVMTQDQKTFVPRKKVALLKRILKEVMQFNTLRFYFP